MHRHPALLLLLFALLAVSCAKTDRGGHAKTIGVALLTRSHIFYKDLEEGLREEAARQNFELIITSAELDLGKQIGQIEDFVARKVDAIIVCPVDSKGVGPGIRKANEANIPVFTADIAAQEGSVVSHIASDNVAGGRLAGEYLARALGGRGKVAIINHPVVTSVLDRVQGFHNALAAYPGITIVADVEGQGVRDKSLEVTADVLQANPALDGIFGINDASALGALDAVQQFKRDKIVIVGSSATALGDLRVTPISNVYPGAEILATAIDNLKNQRWMRRAPGYAQMALAALLLAFVWEAFRLRHNALEIGIAFGLISAALLGASYAALNARLILPVLVPLAFAWAFYLYGSMLAYLREKRTREQAVRLFSRFLDPNVVKKIVDQGETIESLSGKTRQISILFSDIRGFTTLSETRPPQEIVSLLNRYFSRQVDVVFRHGGTLDKFIGDCIMAFWGAPLDDPRHAEHAVAAALEMEQVLKSFKEDLGEAGRDFDVGIGIHSGTAVVGFIGAEQKLDYTAIGDAVNLASRIEGLTKDAKSRILVSSDTVEACHNSFEFTSRGRYKVKGRAQEVELFEPRPKSA